MRHWEGIHRFQQTGRGFTTGKFKNLGSTSSGLSNYTCEQCFLLFQKHWAACLGVFAAAVPSAWTSSSNGRSLLIGLISAFTNHRAFLTLVILYHGNLFLSLQLLPLTEIVFIYFLLNLLGWHWLITLVYWLIKLYRLQVYNSITHHLNVVLCVHNPMSNLLPSNLLIYYLFILCLSF